MVSVLRGAEIYSNFYLRRRTPTLVYAMGRVGSVAVFKSLLGHGEFALHAHILHPENLKRKKGKRPGTSKWAYRQIICKRRPVKIISLVRNPIECMISAFAPEVRALDDSLDKSRDLSAQDLSDQFQSGYFDRQRHLVKLNWFDNEFRPALGIDVYKYPFDKDRGFIRFQEGPCDILIVRSELDDETKGQLLAEFVGVAELKIIRTRVGEQQPYGKLYEVFRRQVNISEEYMDAVTNSRFAQHFLTQVELSATRDRFTVGEGAVPSTW